MSCFSIGSDDETSAAELIAEAEDCLRPPEERVAGTEVFVFLGLGPARPRERGIAHLRYTPRAGRARATSTIIPMQWRRIFYTASRRQEPLTSCEISSTWYRNLRHQRAEPAVRRTPGEHAFTGLLP